MNEIILVIIRWVGLLILMITGIYLASIAAKFILPLFAKSGEKFFKKPSKNAACDTPEKVIASHHQSERKRTLSDEDITNLFLALVCAVIIGLFIFNYVFKR